MTNARTFSWQPSLLDAAVERPGFDASFASARRFELEPGAWVDHCAAWVAGADTLFTDLLEHAPWSQRRRHMYDRVVDEPRLTAGWSLETAEGLPAILPSMAAALSKRYDKMFDSIGAALYRDGRDSVAWHGDRIPVEIVEPVVAIVSLGSPRTLRMRSKSRHRDTRSFTLLPGDLLVMGGTTQRTWEHSIPKVRFAAPRMSVQFRHN
jgi:alkylated DNA repair dioxygenase AlkB